jgi:uncharacterized lipoprotein YddW (UPF0748 family)
VVLALLAAACSGGTAGDETSTTEPSPTSTSTDEATTTTPRGIASTTEVPAVPVPAGPPSSSVWVHLFDDTLKSPEGVESMLDEVAEAGIEAVIAQVARRHDAYYDSAYLPPTPDPALEPGFDVLDALVEGAHERGLQVHAWFVVAPAYHREYDDLVMPAGHVWLEHGPGSDDSWMTVDASGTPSSDYFDVGLPAVHDHVAELIADIAGRYPVDGIHLDYVRYDGQQWGYHPDALAQFALDTGRTDRPAVDDPDWSRWRTERTAALIERAASTLDQVRPDAMLSAAVIAGGEGPSATGGFQQTRAATHMFQDWPGWLDADSVDFVLAMAYVREQVPEHAGWFRQWVEFVGGLSEQHPGRVTIGIGAYLNSVEDGQTQLDLVREATGQVAIYSYQQDSADSPRGALLQTCCRD